MTVPFMSHFNSAWDLYGSVCNYSLPEFLQKMFHVIVGDVGAKGSSNLPYLLLWHPLEPPLGTSQPANLCTTLKCVFLFPTKFSVTTEIETFLWYLTFLHCFQLNIVLVVVILRVFILSDHSGLVQYYHFITFICEIVVYRDLWVIYM